VHVVERVVRQRPVTFFGHLAHLGLVNRHDTARAAHNAGLAREGRRARAVLLLNCVPVRFFERNDLIFRQHVGHGNLLEMLSRFNPARDRVCDHWGQEFPDERCSAAHTLPELSDPAALARPVVGRRGHACILLRVNYERGGDIREGLACTARTVCWRPFRAGLRAFVWKTPPITPPPPRLLHLLWMAAHLAIYLWLIAMPVAGWVILSAEGDPIPFWGLNLPALTGVNEALAGQVEELHETGGTVGYFLLGLHAAAALFHHYGMKDTTLARMRHAGMNWATSRDCPRHTGGVIASTNRFSWSR
jgi:cytochrome b561